ncbi:GTPase HflX [Candidatus Poribacteria bacterium]|nr:GTPase HflX [Candidatus Poribacteria bacterium]
MQEIQELEEKPERAIIVGVKLADMSKAEAEESLQELALLADTAGVEVVSQVLHQRPAPNPAYFVGSGKAQELQSLSAEAQADVLIFDNDLSPAQTRNLEKITDIRVIDRTTLILDIFAQRARTKEAKVQVELAQLQYALPRLTHQWTHLERLGGGAGAGKVGGVGTRGPGETQLQIDRQLIRGRIAHLKRELEEIEQHRTVQRRHRKEMMSAAIVGYTNAGKSTLLNALTDEHVFTEDKLFATLDPTTRIVQLPENHTIFLTDTVGFIKRLPHHLVASFKATLEEVTSADLLLHIVNASHKEALNQIKAVNQVLEELGAVNKPTLMLFNKIDKLALERSEGMESYNELYVLHSEYPDGIAISALTGEGLEQLKSRLVEFISQNDVRISLVLSHKDGGKVLNYIYTHGEVLDESYKDNSVLVEAKIHSRYLKQLKKLAPTGVSL